MSVRGVIGLAIIVATADAERLHMALRLAASHAALGGRTRLLLDDVAVPAVQIGGALLESCFELGAEIILCQSGMAAVGLEAGALDGRLQFGGMVSFLAQLENDRLVVV
ncbi:peroxiredoxin [Sphingomonas sp.]|uniref:peroxiredoxin n=1 Tax=Sphingomonas sp. TaxID=28214 RepID=UPI003B3B6FE4